MDVRVDVSNTKAGVLADAAGQPARTPHHGVRRSNEQADAEVRRIIAANLGRRGGERVAAPRPAAPTRRAPRRRREAPPAVARSSAPLAVR